MSAAALPSASLCSRFTSAIRSLAVATLLVAACGATAAGQAGLRAEPLAPRVATRGATLFNSLPPEVTGIVVENRYDDPRMWADRYNEFVYGAIGTGVAIADHDGDGRPDIYVVSKLEGGRLFRNLGGWKFEDVTEAAGVSGLASGWLDRARGWVGLGSSAGKSWFQGAMFADVNNDGHPDLYVCRFGEPNLLFINKGDGTFSEEAGARGLALSDASGVGAFCDYDRDGWLDVHVQTNLLDVVRSPTGQRDRLYRNNGDGTFTDVTDRAGIRGDTQGHSAIWWDFDNDGWPDLYVANDFAPPDSLYRNNGDDTFTDVINSVVPLTPHSSMGADLGDVDNDGLVDFLVADMAATSHEKDQRGMATNRSRLDEMREPPGVAPQYMRNTLFLNTGTGRMREAAFLAGLHASDWTWSVRLEDLDNDGRIDAFFTNGMVRELNNVDLVARTTAAESVGEQVRIMKASPPLAQRNLAFRNLGDLAFEETGAAWGLDERGVSFGAAFGDLDGDGDLDLVYVNYEGRPTVLRNDSDTGHRLIVALQGTRSNKFGVGARVRIESGSGVQVRELVISRGYLSSSEPVLHFGLGDDTRVDRLTVTWPSGTVQTFADIAADQRLTIAEPASTSDRVNAELQTKTDPSQASSGFGVPPLGGRGPSATKTQSLPMFSEAATPPSVVSAGNGLGDEAIEIAARFGPAGARWRSFAKADFNGDGRPDFVAGNLGLNTRYRASADEPALEFTGDFGSGRSAVIEAHYENGRVYPWLSRGEMAAIVPDVRRRFARNDLYARATLAEAVGEERLAAAKRLEITELRSGVFMSQPDGTWRFEPLPRIAQIAPINGVVAGDFNGDGHADIFAVQNSHVPPPSVGHFDGGLGQLLLGDGRGNFRPVPPAESGLVVPGEAVIAVARDFDDDGWPDFVVECSDGRKLAFRNNGVEGRR